MRKRSTATRRLGPHRSAAISHRCCTQVSQSRDPGSVASQQELRWTSSAARALVPTTHRARSDRRSGIERCPLREPCDPTLVRLVDHVRCPASAQPRHWSRVPALLDGYGSLTLRGLPRDGTPLRRHRASLVSARRCASVHRLVVDTPPTHCRPFAYGYRLRPRTERARSDAEATAVRR